MRNTFTLLVEFRGDIRGNEQRLVKDQITAYAEKQDIQCFGYESDNTGTYAFMAHPDYIDEPKDRYELEGFKLTLEPWLIQHQDIDSFTLQPITELSDLFPRIGESPTQATENQTTRDRFFRGIRE